MKNRLYASKYTDLNDPIEGQYYYDKECLTLSMIDSRSNAALSFFGVDSHLLYSKEYTPSDLSTSLMSWT